MDAKKKITEIIPLTTLMLLCSTCLNLFSGASTFPGIRKYIIETSKTRVKCLLHIALHGLAAVGCASGGNGPCLIAVFAYRKTSINWGGAPVAQWLKRWPTDLAIPGSSPPEARPFATINGVTLHTAFHCLPAIVLI